MSAALVGLLLEASLHVAVLTLAALAVERALGARLTPRLRLWLWLVVVARLALPAPPEVPRALAPPTERLIRPWLAASGDDRPRASAPAPSDSLRASRPEAAPRAQPASPLATRAAAPATGSSAAPAAVGVTAQLPTPLVVPSAALEPASLAIGGVEGPAEIQGPSERAARARPHATVARIAPALVAVWLAGAAVLLARFVRADVRLRRAMRAATAPPESLVTEALRAARAARLRRPPRVLLTEAVRSPAVHGLLRATVLVPPRFLALTPRERACVLAHECSHVRRGDLLLAPLCALLRAAWWFHPLARLALSRAADALEEARDADALRTLDATREDGQAGQASGASARLAYARVLVLLAEARAGDVSPTPTLGALAMAVRPSGLTRRVHMILEPQHPSWSRRLVGASAVVVIGWMGLAAAAPPRQTEGEPSGPAAVVGARTAGASAAPAQSSDASPLQSSRIAVEAPALPPPWLVELEAKLRRRLPAVDFERAPLCEAIGELAAAAGVGVVFADEVASQHAAHWVTLAVRDVTVREVLAVLLEYGDGLGHALVRTGERAGAVLVGQEQQLPRPVELRLYRVAGLLDSLRAPFGAEDVSMDDLIELVQGFATESYEIWHLEGTSITSWEGLLCVRQTPEVHAEVQAFLERLAARERAPDRSSELWRADLVRKLAAPVSAEVAGAAVSATVEALAREGGVSIIDPDLALEDYDTAGPIDLAVHGVPLIEAIERSLAGTGFHHALRAGGLEIRPSPRLELHLHPIGTLLGGLDAERRAERFRGIEAFLRSSVDPDSWGQFDGVSYQRVGDLLVVRQSAENQARIEELLAQLERALRQ